MNSSWVLLLFSTLVVVLPFNSIYGILAGAKPSTAALPSDAFAGATNPAGNVLVGDRVDFCAMWWHTEASTTIRNNPIPGANGHYNATRRKDYLFPEGAINKTFKTEICCKPIEWSLGLIAYTHPGFRKTTYETPVPLAGTTKLGLEFLSYVISPVVAVKLNEKHSLGISFDFFIERIKANGLEFFATPLSTVAPHHITNKGYGYTLGVAPSLGWRWQITKELAFGASWRPKVKMSKNRRYIGLLPDRGESDVPAKALVGIIYSFTEKFGMAFDVEWLNWRAVQISNPTLNTHKRFGSKHGPGFGYPNQVLFRFGLGYKFSDKIYLRGAYFHANSLATPKETFVNTLTCATLQDYLSIGATYTHCKKYEFTLYYIHGFEHKVKGIKNSIPDFLGGGRINLKESRDSVLFNIGYKY